MAHSTNPAIQKLMNEVAAIKDSDPELSEKLNIIAQKVAEEQRKIKQQLTGIADDRQFVDPADAFACEGCQ